MFLSDERRRAIDERVTGSAVGKFLTSRTALAFFYGIFLFLYELKFLRQLVPEVHPVLIGWSAALICYDFLIRKAWKTIPYYPFFVLFGISAAVTALVRQDTGLAGNLKSLVMSVLPLMAFYPVCFCQERRKAMILSLLGAAAVVFIASAVGVALYLIRFSRVVTFLGMEELIGFRLYDDRFANSGIIHYGIYSDTNHAAAYAIIFAAYSAALYIACRKGIFRKRWQNRLCMVFGIANLAAQVCYFPLANSRGGWLALYIAGAVAVFCYLLCGTRHRERRAARAVASALVSVAAVALVCLMVLFLRSGLSRASMLAERVNAPPTEPTASAVETAAPDSFDKISTSTAGGRLEIWQEALKLYGHYPIFGIGPGNEQRYAQKFFDSGMLIYGKAIHNSYLDLLVGYGAVGFGFLMTFFGLCAVTALKRLFSGGRDAVECLILGGVITGVCAAFLLSCAFVSTTAMYFLLLILTGYLVSGREAA